MGKVQGIDDVVTRIGRDVANPMRTASSMLHRRGILHETDPAEVEATAVA